MTAEEKYENEISFINDFLKGKDFLGIPVKIICPFKLHDGNCELSYNVGDKGVLEIHLSEKAVLVLNETMAVLMTAEDITKYLEVDVEEIAKREIV
ncbi:MAG: hypothetical protein LKF48_07380 [Prevotella sp.]|jgi:hypothetical protein|nr:hypothetical protein [Prevotella sp.]MCH4182960.1 hypothetical protein [Prevotella sp.]